MGAIRRREGRALVSRARHESSCFQARNGVSRDECSLFKPAGFLQFSACGFVSLMHPTGRVGDSIGDSTQQGFGNEFHSTGGLPKEGSFRLSLALRRVVRLGSRR